MATTSIKTKQASKKLKSGSVSFNSNFKKGYTTNGQISYSSSINMPSPQSYSKLEEIRNRIDEKERIEKEEREYKEYKERYTTFLENSIEEIDILVDYFLNKCEVIIEKDYESYVIRKTINEKSNISNISIRVSINSLNLQCENNNFYDSIELIDNTLYEKYSNLFEIKYFEYLNRKTKKIVDEIQNITKLSRKSKINKMIENVYDNSEE